MMDIKAIEERANAATPGLWETGKTLSGHNGAITSYGTILAEVVYVRDNEFIAPSRSDIEFLLAEVKRLQAELDAAVENILDRIAENAENVVDAIEFQDRETLRGIVKGE